MWKTLKHIAIPFVCIVTTCSLFAAQYDGDDDDVRLDSMLHVVASMPNDTTRLAILNSISYEHYSVDTVAKYAQMQLDLARTLHHGYYEAKALGYLYWCNFHYNDFVKANDYAFKAIVVGDSIGNKRIVASNYLNLGVIYSMMQDATQANAYYHKALDMFTDLSDSVQMCEVLRNIGYNNNLYEMFDASEECYSRALEIDQRMNDAESVSEDLLGLGDLLLNKYSSSLTPDTATLMRAKKYYQQAYTTAKLIDYEYSLFIVRAELPMVLLTELNVFGYTGKRCNEILDSCKVLLTQGYAMAHKFGYSTDKIDIDFGWVSYLVKKHNYGAAQHMLDSLNTLFDTDAKAYKHYRAKLYKGYAMLYREMGNYKQAYEAHVKYEYYHRQNRKKDYEITARLNMAQAQFDNQMEQQHRHELTLKSEADKSAIISIATLVVLLLVSVLAIVIARYYIRSRKTNALLDAKNNELEQQKEETIAQNECLARQNEQIEQQNKIITQVNNEITDSISYASIIQQATLPSEQLLQNMFAEHMIIYRPLNIVSGDFYWAIQTKRCKMIAVADCTGHGVPGAFLSMLGMSILDYLTMNEKDNDRIPNAGQMLDNVRTHFKQSLHQTDDGNHDGIDMALLIIDTQTNNATYAGAFRPLIVVHNGEPQRFEPDRMPIGTHYKEAEHFTNNIVNLYKGDTVYMFSDGITDQFGYDIEGRMRKFTTQRFMQLLSNIATLPLSKQKVKIETAIDKWMTTTDGTKKCEQTDDAVIIGVRI